MQVWLIDDKGYYMNVTKNVDKVGENMTDTPLMVGYIKPYFNGTEWVEGATEEEIQTWKDSQQIEICTPKTNQELQEEIENLKAQLEAVHERLCTQQEMSATVIASVFGMEALKNE